MNLSSFQPLTEKKYIYIGFGAIVATILVMATIGPSLLVAASDDDDGLVSFSGGGFQVSVRTSRETVTIDDCGDADPLTLVRTQTDLNTRTYSGIIEGTAEAESVAITYINCTAGLIHANLMQLESFDEVTVAGRTGGAVIERIGTFESRDGVVIVTINERFLCGTGELEGIHGTGILQREGDRPRAYLFSGHFGHDHGTGWEHLCNGLGNGDDSS